MDITIYDTAFTPIAVLDELSSLIWTDRYYKYGDFELRLRPSTTLASLLAKKRYISIPNSPHMMIIETHEITTKETGEGDEFVVKGRSLESILDRRICLTQTILDGSSNVQLQIQDLLNDNIISPTDTNRAISNFVFLASTDTAVFWQFLDNEQFEIGTSIYTIVSDICHKLGLGYRIFLNSDGELEFLVYAGTNRTTSQLVRSPVVFSANFGNLLSTGFYTTDQFLRTHAIVEGDDSDGTQVLAEINNEFVESTGIDRRELYVDSKDLSKFYEGTSTPIPPADYLEMLDAKGTDELKDHTDVKSFDGQADTSVYNYGTDFFLGDTVVMIDGYGNSGGSKISEVTISLDLEGLRIYPTFES